MKKFGIRIITLGEGLFIIQSSCCLDPHIVAFMLYWPRLPVWTERSAHETPTACASIHSTDR